MVNIVYFRANKLGIDNFFGRPGVIPPSGRASFDGGFGDIVSRD